MEHTHLVKGLDYALLQKVNSEIDVNPEDGEEEEQEVVEQQQQENQNNHETIIKAEKKDNKVSSASGSSGSVITDLESTFKTKLARNINRVLFKTTLPERNELFIPGRMAYVMDLEEEYAESDIPTTLIRSKADCPLEAEGLATLTTNDIVINKLAQILSYLRQGTKSSKKHRKNNKEVNNRPSTREEKVLQNTKQMYF
jgi:IK cytokine